MNSPSRPECQPLIAERLLELRAHLQDFQFRFSDEVQLHQGIATALEAGGYTFEHECWLDSSSRVDFRLDGIVIEVKVAGSYSAALAQAHRYARIPDVSAVMLATTKRWAMSDEDRLFYVAGKPVSLCPLARKVF